MVRGLLILAEAKAAQGNSKEPATTGVLGWYPREEGRRKSSNLIFPNRQAIATGESGLVLLKNIADELIANAARVVVFLEASRANL